MYVFTLWERERLLRDVGYSENQLHKSACPLSTCASHLAVEVLYIYELTSLEVDSGFGLETLSPVPCDMTRFRMCRFFGGCC